VLNVSFFQLWNTRIEAGAGEHGLTRRELLEGLARVSIQNELP